MRFSTCTFIVLSLGSAVVPSIALPTYLRAYPSYTSARDNLIAREIAQSLIPEDESGALSAQQVKDFGKKAWQKTKQIAKVAAPYALQLAPLALALREEPELWARLE